MFTHNVQKIKGITHKNGDVNGTCKQAFIIEPSFIGIGIGIGVGQYKHTIRVTRLPCGGEVGGGVGISF